MGAKLQLRNPVPISFSQIISYLNISRLLHARMAVNGICEKRTIAPDGFTILRYPPHKSSKGITESHEFFVVPYGKSHITQSTLPSGILFMPSRQSSLYILFSSIISLYLSTFVLFYLHTYLLTYLPCRLLPRYSRLRVVERSEHFAVNLPNEVRVPIVEA